MILSSYSFLSITTVDCPLSAGTITVESSSLRLSMLGNQRVEGYWPVVWLFGECPPVKTLWLPLLCCLCIELCGDHLELQL